MGNGNMAVATLVLGGQTPLYKVHNSHPGTQTTSIKHVYAGDYCVQAEAAKLTCCKSLFDCMCPHSADIDSVK